MNTNKNNTAMPFLGSTNFLDVTPDVAKVQIPNKGSHNVVIQVYTPKMPRYRILPANPAKGMNFPFAVVEMHFHSPASSGAYEIVPIWLVLPSNHNIGNQGSLSVNNITATPLWNNLVNKDSLFNAAIVMGLTNNLLVPGPNWNQSLHANKTDSELSRLSGVLNPSDVIVVGTNGLVPMLTYDHTVSYKDPELDYEAVRVKYGVNNTDGVFPLRSHPVTNVISGFSSINSDKLTNSFYDSCSARMGIVDSRNKDDLRKRFVFTAGVYRNGIDDIGSEILMEVADIQRPSGPDSTSRCQAFHSSVAMAGAGVSGISFNGELRLGPIRNSTGSYFRVSINNWTLLGSGNAEALSSKAVDTSINIGSVETVGIPGAVASDPLIVSSALADEPEAEMPLMDDDSSGDMMDIDLDTGVISESIDPDPLALKDGIEAITTVVSDSDLKVVV